MTGRSSPITMHGQTRLAFRLSPCRPTSDLRFVKAGSLLENPSGACLRLSIAGLRGREKPDPGRLRPFQRRSEHPSRIAVDFFNNLLPLSVTQSLGGWAIPIRVSDRWCRGCHHGAVPTRLVNPVSAENPWTAPRPRGTLRKSDASRLHGSDDRRGRSVLRGNAATGRRR
jgi:hypothetical protein